MITGKRSRQQFNAGSASQGDADDEVKGITISLRFNKETSLYQFDDVQVGAKNSSSSLLKDVKNNNRLSVIPGGLYKRYNDQGSASKRAKKSAQVIKPPPAYSDEDEMSSREPAKKALKPINGQPGGDGDVEIDTIRAQQLKVERELQAYSGRSFIVPSCSAWFHFDQIHEIEMQNLPEFFCAKFPHKNPVTYLNFRNAIIRMYREKPDTYLTASGKYSLKFYYIDCLLSRA